MNIVILTGATGGLGKATSEILAQEGYSLVLTARSSQKLASLKSKLVRQFPKQQFWAVEADLTKTEEIINLFKQKEIPYTNLFGLVNNAGIAVGNDIFSLTEKDWDKDISLNLKAPFLLMQQFVICLKKYNHIGSIVNISSLAGITGAKKPNYSASKAGLIGLTKSAALTLGVYNIRVNAVVPGAVNTPLISDWDEKKRVIISKRIPLGRIARPVEIAQVISFLLSPEASYLTGAVVNASGGQYMG